MRTSANPDNFGASDHIAQPPPHRQKHDQFDKAYRREKPATDEEAKNRHPFDQQWDGENEVANDTLVGGSRAAGCVVHYPQAEGTFPNTCAGKIAQEHIKEQRDVDERA